MKKELINDDNTFVNIITERILKEKPIPKLKGKNKANFEKEFNRFKQILDLVNQPSKEEIFKKIILWFIEWSKNNITNLNNKPITKIYYVFKDGKCLSDYKNYEKALNHAKQINGTVAFDITDNNTENIETQMKKYYPVFSIDICFDSYASNEILVGAESKKDLINHLNDFIKLKKHVKQIIKDNEWRIKEIPNLFTNKIYSILDSYAYFE